MKKIAAQKIRINEAFIWGIAIKGDLSMRAQ
jgi:hypothetical protein